MVGNIEKRDRFNKLKNKRNSPVRRILISENGDCVARCSKQITIIVELKAGCFVILINSIHVLKLLRICIIYVKDSALLE